MPSPKPFVKLDEALEVGQKLRDSTGLQLEGTGLSSGISRSVELVKLDKPKTAPPSKRYARHQLHQPLAVDALALQGARVVVPKPNGVEKPVELTGFEGMEPLSKTEKERLWREFAAEPIPSNIQDAYAILYPQTYQVPVLRVAQVPSILENTSSDPVGLRVDATRQPVQKAVELNRKFWSAVEGYRAIGSSSLVPLDAATIAQRRQGQGPSHRRPVSA
ncbi:hypothetical protein DVH05_024470 [Phytophthora capsici]|nr:hypothetical protein DVH05_024470 [Phytophthora capsici]